MDRVAELKTTVQQIVEDYSTPVLKGKSFAISDPIRKHYTVLAVPDLSHKFDASITVLARVVEDTVIIEEDTTDRPLWKELVAAGIPREKIILTYAGETAPDEKKE